MIIETWLTKLLDSRSDFESPRKFFYWSALAAISSVVKRKIYLRKRSGGRTNYLLYPNIYVFLVGDSAIVRKGPPVKMARKLVKAVGSTRIISGRSSFQGIIKELATARTVYDEKTQTQTVLHDSSAFICASELRSSLIQDPQAFATLTDLHDGDFADEWKTLLRGSGVEELKDVNITILGGTNPAYLKDIISGSDVEGGIIGRSFMVYAKERQTINPLTEDVEGEDDEDDDEEDNQYNEEANYLKELSKLHGYFKYSKAAKDLYDEWYREFTTRKVDDRTGTFGRLHDQVLKVAMLLSLTKKTELVLDKETMEEAISSCLDIASDLSRSIMPAGRSEISGKMVTILQDLINRNGEEVKRRVLLTKFYGEVSYQDLDIIIENLKNAQALEVRRHGKDVYYALTQKALNQYNEFRGEE